MDFFDIQNGFFVINDTLAHIMTTERERERERERDRQRDRETERERVRVRRWREVGGGVDSRQKE